MKYNIPYGVAGEICKYLSYNDIVEALTAKLFENNIDVIHYKKVTKARMLAKMAVNSSFNYTKNKNITTHQLFVLLLEHAKILRKHLIRYDRSTLYKKFKFTTKELNDDIKDIEEFVNTIKKSFPNSYLRISSFALDENEMLKCIKNKYEHKDVYCGIVQTRFPKCPIESILSDNKIAQNKRKHTDMRDLKSFISPKQVKLLKLTN